MWLLIQCYVKIAHLLLCSVRPGRCFVCSERTTVVHSICHHCCDSLTTVSACCRKKLWQCIQNQSSNERNLNVSFSAILENILCVCAPSKGPDLCLGVCVRRKYCARNYRPLFLSVRAAALPFSRLTTTSCETLSTCQHVTAAFQFQTILQNFFKQFTLPFTF